MFLSYGPLRDQDIALCDGLSDWTAGLYDIRLLAISNLHRTVKAAHSWLKFLTPWREDVRGFSSSTAVCVEQTFRAAGRELKVIW